MRCPRCGTENKEGELFCQDCGNLIGLEMPVIGEEYLEEVLPKDPERQPEPMGVEGDDEVWHSVKWINASRANKKEAPVEKLPVTEEVYEAIPVAALGEERIEAIPAAALEEPMIEAIPVAALGEERIEAIPVAGFEEPLIEAIPVTALGEEKLEAVPVYAHGAVEGEKPAVTEDAVAAIPLAAIPANTLRPEPVRGSEGVRHGTRKPVQEKPKQEPDRRFRRDENQNRNRTSYRDERKERPSNHDAGRSAQERDDSFRTNRGYSSVGERTKAEANKLRFDEVQTAEPKKRKPVSEPVPKPIPKPIRVKELLPWAIALICLLLLLVVLLARCDGSPAAETTAPVGINGENVHGPVEPGPGQSDKDETPDEQTDPGETEAAAETTEPTVPETKEPVYKSVYRVVARDISWEDARRECEAQGGTLATITSAEEFYTICEEANKSGLTVLWLGACLEGNDWANQTWISGEAMSFTKWYDGEPSYFDTGDNVKESYLCMWKVKKDVNDWTFNDQRNDPVKDYPKQFSGKMGYVLELKVEVTE